MPAWVEPCKPTLVRTPPQGPQWLHEIKWDGYRVSAYLKDGAVLIMTSGGLDWTARFPAIAAAVADLPVRSAIIDGEDVVLDEHGRSHFGDRQAALGRHGNGRQNAVVKLSPLTLACADPCFRLCFLQA